MSSKLELTGMEPASARAPVSGKSTPIDRRSLTVLWIGILLAVVGLGSMGVAGYTYWINRDPAAIFLAKNARQDGVRTTASGLQYKMLTPGAGKATPTDDDVALITYTGTLTNGAPFDRSPQPTPMPASGVVPGFAEAMKLMPKGSKYRFWIPPALGYGDKDQKDPSGHVAIPAHSVLVFDVDMLDWKSEAEIQMMQQLMQQRMQQAHPGQGAPGAGAPAGGAMLPDGAGAPQGQ
jgi:FKBP-type peptidyl-prolyl cis-trans isomerase FkpA